jgi:hypothetical protein
MTDIWFGFWPKQWTITAGAIHIEPLPDFQEVVKLINDDDRAAGDWFHPPLTPAYAPGTPHDERPEVYAPRYSLSPTHLLTLPDSDGRVCGELLLAVLGMVEGLRLIPEDWGHFYRTAIRAHKLCDLICSRSDLAHVLGATHVFWHAHSIPEIRRGIFGAIHWLLFSQSYEHQFEEFGPQYTVLDACYHVHCLIHGAPSPRVSHARRASFLATQYSIPEPTWAAMRPDSACDLSEIRNAFIHEGRYGSDPIGFGHPTSHPSIVLELKAFNMRVVLGILGIGCGYVKSPVNTRQLHGLDLGK